MITVSQDSKVKSQIMSTCVPCARCPLAFVLYVTNLCLSSTFAFCLWPFDLRESA
ncbi:MAG: hypothetical protein HW394_491 [Acidobacteria bacterium]|nr:hypothetical protein [Acidobacteriota bacterium]